MLNAAPRQRAVFQGLSLGEDLEAGSLRAVLKFDQSPGMVVWQIVAAMRLFINLPFQAVLNKLGSLRRVSPQQAYNTACQPPCYKEQNRNTNRHVGAAACPKSAAQVQSCQVCLSIGHQIH